MNRRNSLKLGATLIAGITIPGLVSSTEMSVDKVSQSFLDLIKTRRSIRKFKSDPIPEEHLLAIVDAARMAPCAGNEQPWKFLIVQKKDQVAALRNELIKETEKYLNKNQNLTSEKLKKQAEKMTDERIDGRLSAPAYIVVLADKARQYPTYNRHDGPLAACTLLLAAWAFGYGTVYLTDSFPEHVVKKVFNIPDQYEMVCLTPIGIPDEKPKPKKKELKEVIIKEGF